MYTRVDPIFTSAIIINTPLALLLLLLFLLLLLLFFVGEGGKKERRKRKSLEPTAMDIVDVVPFNTGTTKKKEKIVKYALEIHAGRDVGAVVLFLFFKKGEGREREATVSGRSVGRSVESTY